MSLLFLFWSLLYHFAFLRFFQPIPPPPLPGLDKHSWQNFQAGFAPKEAWAWGALSERFGNSTVRVSLSETGRYNTFSVQIIIVAAVFAS